MQIFLAIVSVRNKATALGSREIASLHDDTRAAGEQQPWLAAIFLAGCLALLVENVLRAGRRRAS